MNAGERITYTAYTCCKPFLANRCLSRNTLSNPRTPGAHHEPMSVQRENNGPMSAAQGRVELITLKTRGPRDAVT